MLSKIASFFTTIGLIVSSIFHPQPAPVPNQSPAQVQTDQISQDLGATNAVSDTVAFFTASLQSPISATADSMTLVSAAYNNGANNLASSTYGFVIDEGTSLQEIVVADCTATVCTNMDRGIDYLTGTSSVTSLAFAHRRGASVKITNAPSQLIYNRIFEGIGGVPNIMFYGSPPSFVSGTQIIDKTYADNLAFSGAGVVDATPTARGVVELATTLETASSSAVGSSGNLVIPSTNSTSTYNAATAPLRVVVTQNNGKIDHNFLSPGIAYFADSAANDSYLVNPTPALSSTTQTYATGQIIAFKAATSNIGTSTLNVSSLGAKSITKNFGSQLADNDIIAGQMVQVEYDGSNWEMVSPVSETGLYKLGEGRLGSAAATLSVTGLTNTTASSTMARNMLVYVYIPSGATGNNSTMGLQFNGDSGSNYIYSYDTNTTGTVLAAAIGTTTRYIFNSPDISGSNTGQGKALGTIHIYNTALDYKLITSQAINYDDKGVGLPNLTNSGGVWKNSVSQINRIDVIPSSGTLPAGSDITVYASDN